MWYTYSVTDLVAYESDAVAVELDERQARAFGVSMAHRLLNALPELSDKGICVVVYDIDDQPVSIVPLDPIQ
jgi:predicted neutral ceramidase superfamily lipid hydrolase